MPLDYVATAKEIIGNAIRSTIFIDDKISIPFQEEPKPEEIALSRDLYRSFQNHNCGLDFYKFAETENWRNKIDYLLKSRDLFIIDWELNSKGILYRSTLEILSEAVKKESLHFICIYTNTEKKDFQDIVYTLNAHFAPFDIEELEKDFEKIKNLLLENGFDISEVFNDEMLTRFKELVLYKERWGQIFPEIKDIIENKTSKEILSKINTILSGGNYKKSIYGYCGIGFLLNEEIISSDPDLKIETRNYVEKDFLLIINHTLVMIVNKKEIEPNLLYDKFSNALIESSGNFLTLMGLEMRNLFKESSGFIGKDIDSIDELAFFHHKQHAMPKGSFYDFLKELWKSQAASFLYHKNTQPKIFDSLDNYVQENDIEAKLVEFSKSAERHEQPLGRLNYYYNILHTSRPDNDGIRFGDIFNINDVNSTPTNDYLLCITAHCDCLYPAENIKNLFYFVRGTKGNLTKILDEGDKGFNSFILNERTGRIETIEWQHRPFTVFISGQNNNIELNIPCNINEEQIFLKYSCTLKENYAQRIANQGFSHSLRVGIYFTSKPH